MTDKEIYERFMLWMGMKPSKTKQVEENTVIRYEDIDNCDVRFTKTGYGEFYAVAAIKGGKKVARAGWNGRDMYAVIMPGYPDGVTVNEVTQKAHNLPEGTVLYYRPYFQLYTAQKDVAMWAPSGSDALAEDWLIVE